MLFNFNFCVLSAEGNAKQEKEEGKSAVAICPCDMVVADKSVHRG